MFNNPGDEENVGGWAPHAAHKTFCTGGSRADAVKVGIVASRVPATKVFPLFG